MFGLIGEKLGHSYSPQIHEFFGDYKYGLFPLKQNEIKAFLENKNIEGFNVTIPYKKEIIKYLDYVDIKAKEIGAVNTAIKKCGKLYGYNTDYYGIIYTLFINNIDIKNKNVLILGTGGASLAVAKVCKDLNANFKFVSRSGEINYTNIYEQKDTEIIINATPVGMYPNSGESLLDLSRFPKLTFVFDLVYNPLLTKILFDAKKLNIKYANGLTMLVAQAKMSHDIFLGREFNISEIKEDKVISNCVDYINKMTKNIVLIGMAGSGKSCIGRNLAKKLNKTFIDTDGEINKRIKMTIKDFFNRYGEREFRKIESQVVKEFSCKNNIVLSTGGGVVTVKENEYFLRQNGIIIRICRDIEKLSSKGRPLMKDGDSIKKLVIEREPLYREFSDAKVDNNGEIENTIEEILKLL